jgi:nucleotide-binding universal stress UspA family protein
MGLALAERHRAGVRIVRAFDPSQYRLCRVDTSCTHAADEHYQQAQEQLLQARDRSRDDHPHLDISSLLAQASPMDLLIEQSWNADTVVLGTRGQARRSTLLAGSRRR